MVLKAELFIKASTVYACVYKLKNFRQNWGVENGGSTYT